MSDRELNEFCLKSTLLGLTEANVLAVYKQNYFRWQYRISDEVIVNGQVVKGIERALLQQPDKEAKPNIESCIISNTIGGIPVTEMDFIQEEIPTQKALYYKYSTNRKDNLILIKRFEIYLKYLDQRKNELENLSEDPLQINELEVSSKHKKLKIVTYESYFQKPEHIVVFEKALQDAKVLINNKFKRHTKESEILEINIITLILYYKNYLNENVKPSHRIYFGQQFGLNYNEKTYRTKLYEYSEAIQIHKVIYDYYFEAIPTLI